MTQDLREWVNLPIVSASIFQISQILKKVSEPDCDCCLRDESVRDRSVAQWQPVSEVVCVAAAAQLFSLELSADPAVPQSRYLLHYNITFK